MIEEQSLCLGCDFINDGKWCEYFRQVTIYRDSCEGFRPKATEESNSSSMACSTADEMELQHRINMAFSILKTALEEEPTNTLLQMALKWLDNDEFSR